MIAIRVCCYTIESLTHRQFEPISYPKLRGDIVLWSKHHVCLKRVLYRPR